MKALLVIDIQNGPVPPVPNGDVVRKARRCSRTVQHDNKT